MSRPIRIEFANALQGNGTGLAIIQMLDCMTRPISFVLNEFLNGLCCRNNGYPVKHLEHQQIFIAGHNQIRTGGERACQHGIIVGIARNLRRERVASNWGSQPPVMADHLRGSQARSRHLPGEFLPV